MISSKNSSGINRKIILSNKRKFYLAVNYRHGPWGTRSFTRRNNRNILERCESGTRFCFQAPSLLQQEIKVKLGNKSGARNHMVWLKFCSYEVPCIRNVQLNRNTPGNIENPTSVCVCNRIGVALLRSRVLTLTLSTVIYLDQIHRWSPLRYNHSSATIHLSTDNTFYVMIHSE